MLTGKRKTAFIFPAFVHSYPEHPFIGLPAAEACFYELLDQISAHTGFDLNGFDFISCDFFENELFTQFITYCYSISLAEDLKQKGLNPDFAAGYSMGIYAALVDSGAISFADGIDLIRKAHESITLITGREEYGMCSIIGLGRNDIQDLIQKEDLPVEITNQNSRFAFVLSGQKDGIRRILESSIAEGALHTRDILTSIPYHSEMLKDTALPFGEFVNNLEFKQPSYGIFSLIDHEVISKPEQLKQEVIRNLYYPLNWFETQVKMIGSDVFYFIECGFGNSLAKNSKFIEGDYRFLSVPGYIRQSERR